MHTAQQTRENPHNWAPAVSAICEPRERRRETLALPGLKKVVQGLGHGGACSEFSPGGPASVWRKVEMRLACTATQIAPNTCGDMRT